MLISFIRGWSINPYLIGLFHTSHYNTSVFRILTADLNIWIIMYESCYNRILTQIPIYWVSFLENMNMYLLFPKSQVQVQIYNEDN